MYLNRTKHIIIHSAKLNLKLTSFQTIRSKSLKLNFKLKMHFYNIFLTSFVDTKYNHFKDLEKNI